MKKTYLMVVGTFLTTLAGYAQLSSEQAYLPLDMENPTARMIGRHSDDRAPGDVIAAADFSNPDNWLIYSKEGTEPEWVITDNVEIVDLGSYIGPMESMTAENGFGAFIALGYLIDDIDGVPEQDAYIEYAIPINCSGIDAVVIEFQQRYRAFNMDQVFLEVTATTWEEGEYVVYELNADLPTNDPVIQTTEIINISEIAADEAAVKIRFRWLETSLDGDFGAGYAWYVDDLIVSEAWDYDQKITAAHHRSGLGLYMENGMEYYMIAPSQTTEITFMGETKNMAGIIQENAKLNVNVIGGDGYAGTSDPFDLPVSGNEFTSCNTTFIPTVLGNYDVTYFFDSDGVEELTENDTIYDLFTVTDYDQKYAYSRDNGISFSEIDNVLTNTGSPFLIGNVMEFFGDDGFGCINVVVSDAPTNVGQEIYAQIMFLEDGEFVYIDQTEGRIITEEENGGEVTLNFDEPIFVSSGQTALVLAGHYGGVNEVEFRMAQPVEEQTVLGYTSGSTTPFYLESPSAIMIRPLMGSHLGMVDENAGPNFIINQNVPNPFDENSVISYELQAAATVTIEVRDATGKVVKRINEGVLQRGSYSLAINANDFDAGLYFYTFIINDQTVTKRMIITD